MSSRRLFLAPAVVLALFGEHARSAIMPRLPTSTWTFEEPTHVIDSTVGNEVDVHVATSGSRDGACVRYAASDASTCSGQPASAKDVIQCRLLDFGDPSPPIEGVLVAATRAGVDPEAFPMEAWSRTDKDGRCRLEVAPDSYWVSFTPRDYAGNAFLTRRPKSGAQRTEILFMPEGSTPQSLCWIRGVVKRPDGGASGEAWVHAVRQSDKAVFHAQPDSGGRYGFCVDKDKFAGEDSFRLFADAPNLRSDVLLVVASTVADLLLVPIQDEKAAASQAVVDELHQHSFALKTVESGHEFEDLQPLKEVVGAARIVSLGVATYGTREFARLNQRVLEYLVSELGFSVLAVEANWPESSAVNEYVLQGTGDPKAALAGLHAWTWNTEEALELIQWMRKWNADEKHAKKVEFQGFDMQYTSAAYHGMHDYLERVDEESAERAGIVLAALRQVLPNGRPRYQNLEPELRDATHAAMQEVLGLLEDSKEIYVKRSSESEWSMAKRCALMLSQSEQMMHPGPGSESSSMRDRFMAENISSMLAEKPAGTRMVVWAHDRHVRDESEPTYVHMGSYLRKSFGRDSVILGSAFNQGAFLAEKSNESGKSAPNSSVPQEVRVGATPEETVEAALARAKNPLAVVDLRHFTKDGPASKWMDASRTMREAGEVFTGEPAMLVHFQPARAYDALMFVESTTSARPLAKIEPKDK